MAKGMKLVRWNPAERQQLAPRLAFFVDDKGLSLGRAACEAQKKLPKARQRTESVLLKMAMPSGYSSVLRNMLVEGRRMRREEQAAKPTRTPTGKFAKRTPTEWRLLARRVWHWRTTGQIKEGDPLSSVLHRAEAIELPPERRKPLARLQKTVPTSRIELERAHGTVHLIDDIPFDPNRTSYDDAPATASESPTVAAPAPVEVQIAPATIASPGAAFAAMVAPAIDALIARHNAESFERIREHMARAVQTMGAQLSAMLEQGMQATVHRIIEAELGALPSIGSAAASVTAPAPAPTPAAPRLAVDVVGGTTGAQREVIKKTFNGSLDVQFVDALRFEDYTPSPERHVVFIPSRNPVSAAMSDKLRRAGVKPRLSKPTATHIVDVIRGLGASLAH